MPQEWVAIACLRCAVHCWIGTQANPKGRRKAAQLRQSGTAVEIHHRKNALELSCAWRDLAAFPFVA